MEKLIYKIDELVEELMEKKADYSNKDHQHDTDGEIRGLRRAQLLLIKEHYNTKRTITEFCPWCETESEDYKTLSELIEDEGYITCEHCGRRILACSMCKVEKCMGPECFELKEKR